MALTVTAQPATIAAAKNQVPLEITTDNYITTVGVKSRLVFGFSAGAAVSDILEMVLPSGTVTFTFVSSPDDSGDQLTAYVSGSVATWVQNLVNELLENYPLSIAYEVEYAGSILSDPSISITAKETGSSWNITVNTTPTGYSAKPGIAGVTELRRDNFRVLINLEKETSYQSDDWEAVIELDPVPDDNSQVQVNLSDIIRASLYPELPIFNQSVITKNPAGIRRRYRYRYCEAYGFPGDPQKVYTSSAFHAVLAGVAPEKWPTFNYPPNDRFMSLWPAKKPKAAAKHQQEFLWWIHDDAGVTSVDLVVDITWTDGTTSQTILMSYNPVALYDILVLPAGYNQLNLGAISPAKIVQSWDVYLANSGTLVTEKRTYELDDHVYPQDHFFLFTNSMGGLETLRCTGESVHKIKTKSRETQRILRPNYSVQDGEYSRQLINARDNFTARTGWMDKNMSQNVMDLLLGSKVWEIRGGIYVPIIIETDTLLLHDDGEYMNAISFEYSTAFDQHSHTR